jgi:hypothetical protein
MTSSSCCVLCFVASGTKSATVVEVEGLRVKHLALRVARAGCKSQSGELRYSHKEVIMVKKTQKPKTRNWMAVQAHFKSGAGNHGDKKKAAGKNACRNKKNWE